MKQRNIGAKALVFFVCFLSLAVVGVAVAKHLEEDTDDSDD
jgi:hypothetical protein